MKKIGKYISFIWIALFLQYSHMILAQEYQLISRASKYKVNKYEEFEISFTINGQGTNFSEPKNLREYFTIVSGPNNKVFSTYDNTGFRVEQSISYIILAKKVGKFIISEASINVGGKIIKSKPIEIEVTAASTDEISDPNDPKFIAKKLAFVKVKIPKNNLYVGEGMVVDYLLYYRTSISNVEILNEPSFNGFYSEVIKEEAKPFQEQLNGELYNVVPLKRFLIFGQKVGKFDLGSLEVRIPTEVPTNRRDYFNLFFNSGTVVNQISIYKVPIITVKPLPALISNKTPFSGGVGNMKLKADLSKSEVKVGEAISLKISLEGSGNIKMVTLPELTFSEQFDQYEPKIYERYSITSKGYQGLKTLEYILVPKFNGNHKLPKISFLYFNTSKNSYEEIVIDNLHINVTGGSNYSEENFESRTRVDNKLTSNTGLKDILFIKNSFNQRKIFYSVSSSTVLLTWVFVLLLSIVIILILRLFFIDYYGSLQKTKEVKNKLREILRFVENSDVNLKEKLNYLNKNFKKIIYESSQNLETNKTSLNDLLLNSIFANDFQNLLKIISDSEKAIYSGMNDEIISSIISEYIRILKKYIN
ncbi:MAG: BatD family protein [Thermaurantimonas sp.]|uniref:BatD family protein n=1 Tax=Thermaurantimonas sp. TaxID=2681568 RepID=UPI00391AC21E